eukprot:1337138-Amorphochlora_amoeboformis.AAC.2
MARSRLHARCILIVWMYMVCAKGEGDGAKGLRAEVKVGHADPLVVDPWEPRCAALIISNSGEWEGERDRYEVGKRAEFDSYRSLEGFNPPGVGGNSPLFSSFWWDAFGYVRMIQENLLC